MKTLILMIIFLVLLGGIILLQILLSKAENKWLGLILPLLTLCFSVLAVLNIATYTSFTTETHTITENGEIINEIIENTKEPITSVPSTVVTVIFVFVIYNIPTVILLAIYVACREKKKKNLELERMNIQDLE